MRIDLSQLTEAELVDLNRRIVERLRMIRQVHAHVKMLEFTIAERVRFQTDVRKVEGVLVRFNKNYIGPGNGRAGIVAVRVVDLQDNSTIRAPDEIRFPSRPRNSRTANVCFWRACQVPDKS